MASSPGSTLTPLQADVLREFFAREQAFFLTGGAALAGYHLGHRTTDDLDLFTTDAEAFERGRFVLGDLAQALGCQLVVRQDAPGFKRFVLTRAADAVVVDLVKDVGYQQHADKLVRGGVRLDPPDEILANKLTALLGRAEERDLVDVLLLERAGYTIEDALPVALAKDGGCTPATLAWLLSEVTIPEGLELPANVTTAELRAYVDDLIRRLRRAALPEPPSPA